MNKSFDVVVIGAGPAGYIAAIRASQNGMSVACIDEWQNRDGKNAFGGTCLNAGCIPSKALLASSHHFSDASKNFEKHGIDIKGLSVNFEQMIKRMSAYKALEQKALDNFKDHKCRIGLNSQSK